MVGRWRDLLVSTAIAFGEVPPTSLWFLGHRHTATTERYAHLADRFLLDAAERAAEEIVRLRSRGIWCRLLALSPHEACGR